MSIKESIANIISENGKYGIFTGGVDKKKIEELETLMGTQLPNSFKWFLENYGHGGIGGVEILGIAKSDIPACKEATDGLKEYDLPEGYVVIEDCGEYYYCLDTLRIDDSGECPVINWDMIEGDGIEYSNFLDFLYERLLISTKNLK